MSIPSSPEVEKASSDLVTDFIGLEELYPLRLAQHRATLASLSPQTGLEEAADVVKSEIDAALEGEVDRELVVTVLRIAAPVLLAAKEAE